MKQRKVTITKLRDEIAYLVNLKHRFLMQNGWEFSCDYPDCRWRYKKNIDLVVLTLTRQEAVDFELRMGGCE